MTNQVSKLSSLINYFVSNPRKIFFLDGLGAVLSVFLLGVVLVKFENTIGMPSQRLFFLAKIASVFALYSFSSAFIINKKWRKPLKIIAWANLSYCFITFSLLFLHYHELTILGIIYFLLEIIIIIIISLAALELKISNQ